MLDIKLIHKELDQIKENIKSRNINFDIDLLINAHNRKKIALQQLETLRSESNKVAKKIPVASKEERDELIKKGAELKLLEDEQKSVTRVADEEYQNLMLMVPNLMASDTPLGADDLDNVLLRKIGEIPKFKFTPKDHLDLGKDLDIIDFESGTKVTGSKFYFLKNEGADLEIALQNYAIAKAKESGFKFLRTPDLAKANIIQGSGFNPKGDNSNIYRLAGNDLCLIGTSEITIGGMLSDRLYLKKMLPEKYVGLSHCFRMEAGASGQSSKGLYRVHQFSKVELYILASPENSEEHLQEILQIEEKIYSDLGLPYQVLRICAGDLGAPAYKKYDIEVWMPGKGENGEYGEVTSAGNFTDYQARRLNIKFEDENGQIGYPHTLNGTAVATTRVLLAILENFQTEDGSVVIPEVLRPYMGIDIIRAKPIEKIYKDIKPIKLFS